MKYSEQVTNSRQTPCALGQVEAAKRAAAASFFCGDNRNINLCYTKKGCKPEGMVLWHENRIKKENRTQSYTQKRVIRMFSMAEA